MAHKNVGAFLAFFALRRGNALSFALQSAEFKASQAKVWTPDVIVCY
jgi:hypothetical protein